MHFVRENSIVREIWGKADTILFIFAGAAAEFALNKAVDWLYFTGRLPADPLGRLFSTVEYARMIVFSDTDKANATIDRMAQIHSSVEERRGDKIPDWAYRDVLYMLIDYSVSSYEVLERKLSEAEKEEVFDVFVRVGLRMGLKDLPVSYDQWIVSREEHLQQNLQHCHYTEDLFCQYKKHLGAVRYFLLLEVQQLVVPERVATLLNFREISLIRPALVCYKISRLIGMDWFMKSLLMPSEYKDRIRKLDTFRKQ